MKTLDSSRVFLFTFVSELDKTKRQDVTYQQN